MRVCFPLPELSNFDRVNYATLDSLQLAPKHLRNLTHYWQSAPDTNALFEHAMNLYGFRDKEWETQKPADKKRIFFVGDSFVEGIMAEQDHTLTCGFEAATIKEKCRETETFNCGMMGVGVNSYLQFIVDAVPIFKPDFVFLVLYSNDFSSRKPVIPTTRMEAEYHNPWIPRLWELVVQIKAGYPLLFRWNNEKRSFIPAVPAPNNPWTSQEAKLTPHVEPAIAEAMIKGTFNCFAYNQVLYQEQMLKRPVSLKEPLRFLKDFLFKHGSQLVVFYIPARSQVTNHYYPFEQSYCQLDCPDNLDLTLDEYQVHRKRLLTDCEALNVPCFDLTNAVAEQENEANRLYWNYEDHMRGKGYKFLGKTVFEKTYSIIAEAFEASDCI